MRDDIRSSLALLLQWAEAMSSDVGATVEDILREGLENPLSPDEVRALLTRVVEVVHAGATRRGEAGTVELLDREAEGLIERVEQVRAQLQDGEEAVGFEAEGSGASSTSSGSTTSGGRLALRAFDGIRPRPVQPMPVFHERPVAVTEGFVRDTGDTALGRERAAGYPSESVPAEVRPWPGSGRSRVDHDGYDAVAWNRGD